MQLVLGLKINWVLFLTDLQAKKGTEIICKPGILNLIYRKLYKNFAKFHNKFSQILRCIRSIPRQVNQPGTLTSCTSFQVAEMFNSYLFLNRSATWVATKKLPSLHFKFFLENFSGNNGRNCRFSTECRYWYFWNLHHKFWLKKRKKKTNWRLRLLCPKLYLG